MQEDQCRDDADKAVSYDRLLNLLKFNVTEYAVRKARALCSEKVIFLAPPKKEGRKRDENIKSIVKFYEDDKCSRIMPWSKDYVSVGKKQHMQKWLLLANLKELCSSFLKEHADIKIAFSKFCQ